jgi:hypothetical protein
MGSFSMVYRILVEFKGEGSGVEELSWGQQAQWGAILANNGRVQSAGGSMALPEGTTVEQLVHLLGFLMSRHQSLRTRVLLDADGEPRQQLFDTGELFIEVHDVEDDGDPAALAESVEQQWKQAGWELANEWPVRWAIIRQHGVVSHFVALYAHFVIDAYGFEALGADIANMDKATGRHLAPVEGMPPMEQARAQRADAAKRQEAVSLRYWEQQLRAIPLRQPGTSKDVREPRYWEASYRTRAGHLALAVIAARTRLHSGSIVLGAYAAALARVSGVNTSVIRILVSNRFRPGFSSSVSPVAQSALCIIDVEGREFDEIADRAFRSQLAAGRHAYYDPRKLWALFDRIEAERGQRPEMQCYYNDRRRSMAVSTQDLGELPSKTETLAALTESSFHWGEPQSVGPVPFRMNINAVPDTLDYTLIADTSRMSPADIERCMRELETILMEGAFGSAR